MRLAVEQGIVVLLDSVNIRISGIRTYLAEVRSIEVHPAVVAQLVEHNYHNCLANHVAADHIDMNETAASWKRQVGARSRDMT